MYNRQRRVAIFFKFSLASSCDCTRRLACSWRHRDQH